MNRAAFIDANVPIYAAGREHTYKEPCARILMMVADQPQDFFTDAEVLHELMHHYVVAGRWASGREILESFAEVMEGRVEPVYPMDILQAGRLAGAHSRVSARGLVHLAVMQRVGTERIITTDADFDCLSGVVRLDPADFDSW